MQDNKIKLQEKTKIAVLSDFFTRSQASIERATLGRVNTQKLNTEVCLYVLKKPAVLDCTQGSIFNCVLNALQCGLDITRNHYDLVPYGNVATLSITWQGYTKMAMDSNKNIKLIRSEIVRRSDFFEWRWNPDLVMDHKPSFDSSEPFLCYSVAYFEDGRITGKVMTAEDIERRRSFSRSPNSPAWKNNFWQMGLAKVTKMLACSLPHSVSDPSEDDDEYDSSGEIEKPETLDRQKELELEDGLADLIIPVSDAKEKENELSQ